METHFLQAKSISQIYGSHQVLRDINININKPEIYGLLGPSGAGKTTLVKMIAGLESPSTGKIYVLNTEMPHLKVMEKIGYMAQSDALYSELTAKENLNFFASLYGLKKRTINHRLEQAFSSVGLEDAINQKVGHYSGGMKRRLSLAIAMIHRPALLILDEPTVGIDPVLRQRIWKTFQEFKRNGTCIIITTHVMDEAEKCDRLGMVRDGRLMAEGTPEQLKAETDRATIESAFLYYGGTE
nr:ABC transporter ATP-binding protein [Tuberibacillus sp. Marseille-P3662]